MTIFKWLLFFFACACVTSVSAQEVPILNYSLDINGRVQLEVASSEDNYYVLMVRHQPEGAFEVFSSLTLGKEGTTVISESLESYPPGALSRFGISNI